jgi:phosphoribosyl-ATP pyrophosphohydrolase/phosphoribosyl-AMP cyclohydrolase
MSELPSMGPLQFDEHDLIPSIVQDWRDGTVLMMAFMNVEALRQTLRTQRVHFWSRSRQQLWKKGETSGHELIVKKLYVDCDRDVLLVKAEPIGPTCHTGKRSCFFTEMQDERSCEQGETTEAWGGIFERLHEMAVNRKHHPQTGSYVSKLMEGGLDRILKKVIEESGEVSLAAKNQDSHEIVYEIADLWFHTLVLLGYVGISPQEVYRELGERFGKTGMRSTKEVSPSE